MTPQNKLRDAALLAALSAAYPAITFGAGAARVEFANGNVTAQLKGSAARTLSKGAEIFPGETVLTNDGMAQMRFTDGARVSLKPGSEFRIDEYQYNGKPDGEEKGFFSLLKGGLRTITGLVGRNDRTKYQLRTVTATIGIRGTEYSVAYGNSININTGEGIVEVCNSAGCLLLYPGDEGYVAQDSTAPVLIQAGTERPRKDDTPAGLSSIEAPSNDRNDRGEILLGELLTGSRNYGIAIGHTSQFFSANSAAFPDVPGTIDASGALVGFVDSANSLAFDPNAANGGSVQSLGNDGVVAWGRWLGGPGGLVISGSTSGEGGDILHYVAGIPTSPTDPALPPTATYSMLGGSVSGSANGLGTINSASMNVSFSVPQVNSVNIDTTVGSSFQITGGAAPITTSGGQLSFFISSAPVQVGNCTGCPTAVINGVFYGAGASRAGLSFHFVDSFSTFQSIAGAVALKKD